MNWMEREGLRRPQILQSDRPTADRPKLDEIGSRRARDEEEEWSQGRQQATTGAIIFPSTSLTLYTANGVSHSNTNSSTVKYPAPSDYTLSYGTKVSISGLDLRATGCSQFAYPVLIKLEASTYAQDEGDLTSTSEIGLAFYQDSNLVEWTGGGTYRELGDISSHGYAAGSTPSRCELGFDIGQATLPSPPQQSWEGELGETLIPTHVALALKSLRGTYEVECNFAMLKVVT